LGGKQIKKVPAGAIRLLTLCNSDNFDCFHKSLILIWILYHIIFVIVNRFLIFSAVNL